MHGVGVLGASGTWQALSARRVPRSVPAQPRSDRVNPTSGTCWSPASLCSDGATWRAWASLLCTGEGVRAALPPAPPLPFPGCPQLSGPCPPHAGEHTALLSPPHRPGHTSTCRCCEPRLESRRQFYVPPEYRSAGCLPSLTRPPSRPLSRVSSEGAGVTRGPCVPHVLA